MAKAPDKDKAAALWRWHIALVFDSEISPAVVRVGLGLASFINRASGKGWPSYGRLATELRLGKRTVIAAIRKLEDLGWLTRRRTGSGRGHSNVWSLAFGRIDAVEEARAALKGAAADTLSDERDGYRDGITRDGNGAATRNGGARKGADGDKKGCSQTHERVHGQHPEPTEELPQGEPLETPPEGPRLTTRIQGRSLIDSPNLEDRLSPYVDILLAEEAKAQPDRRREMLAKLIGTVRAGHACDGVETWLAQQYAEGRPPSAVLADFERRADSGGFRR